MVLASQLRPGTAVAYEGHNYKVLTADYHPGQGKMGGVTHARFLNLDTGTQWETSLRADLKLEELPLEKKPMEFLYSDDTIGYFMEPVSCDQAEVPLDLIGERRKLLVPEMKVSVEFLGDRPVNVEFPIFLELAVSDTAPPSHSGGTDNTLKVALLENGLEAMVPQFIKTGDSIRIDTNSLKYMDRVKK